MGQERACTRIRRRPQSIPASFPYRYVFVARRGRIPYAAYFMGEGFVSVRRVATTDTQLAFRLHFPEKLAKGIVRPAATLDLRRFEERLWWPITRRKHPYPGEQMSARHFLDALKAGRDMFGLNRSRYATWNIADSRAALAQTKEEKETDYDGASALLQRKVSEQILLIGDSAYALSGEPVYVQRKVFREAKETTIASLGYDRAIDPSLGGLRFPPGQIGDVEEALQRGTFQYCDEDARRPSSVRLEEMPRIELLEPRRAHLCREDVRLDALFRYALGGRRPWNFRDYVSEEMRIAADGLRKVGAADLAAATTSRDRFVALVRLMDFIRDDRDGSLDRCADFRFLERNFSEIRESETLRKFLREANEWSAVDDEAVSQLLDPV